MKYEVLQRSHYKYSLPVKQSINQCIFKPLSTTSQKLLQYDLIINPQATYYHHDDYWGNEVSTFYIWDSHDELLVETRSLLEINYQKQDIFISEQVKNKMKMASFQAEYAEFLMPTSYTMLKKEMIQSVMDKLGEKDTDVYTFLHRLNEYIYNSFAYVPGATHVKTVAYEAFEKRSGVCQDFSHVMLAICRNAGIPARYVSGYIYGGEDAAMRGDSQTHAWIEAYIPEYGWIGFDPTNNMMALNQHICVATGRDYADITPLKGVYIGSGTQDMSVSISVSKVKDNDKVYC
ncbi:transglutaminase family protein [Niallia sp. 01092]|uniref:transglutaminase family protein n=1 Tax=unclassified Niallia TaxID=2837522 RepID=UPI003FCFE119